MRKVVIAGNWKMFKTRDEALQFIYNVNMEIPNRELVESVICAQAPLLRDLVKRQGDHLRIGAQNMHEKTEGAYTGEVSAALLENIGVGYVIIGHSERREHFGETDASVNKKLHQALRYGLRPIVCVGEPLTVREKGGTKDHVERQTEQALAGLKADEMAETVIAYEPIWAIGTGKTATPEMANDAIRTIRETIGRLYDAGTADKVRILYGGSVNTENLGDLIAMEEIDGALVGGASLSSKNFLRMLAIAEEQVT